MFIQCNKYQVPSIDITIHYITDYNHYAEKKTCAFLQNLYKTTKKKTKDSAIILTATN